MNEYRESLLENIGRTAIIRGQVSDTTIREYVKRDVEELSSIDCVEYLVEAIMMLIVKEPANEEWIDG